MCGIIAYKGTTKNAPRLVVEGLKKLEYRGYDSWGVGYLDENGKIAPLIKRVGAIGEVKTVNAVLVKLMHQPSVTALGQTRWATTGRVNQTNAHPHLSNTQKIALVQNGIVENFSQLREMLIKKGFHFKSETDTEVIVNLIEYELKAQSSKLPPSSRLRRASKAQSYNAKGKNFQEAVRRAFNQLEGRNAIVALYEDTGELVAARQGSPLIIGVAEHGYFIASDIPAFLDHTNRVIYLDDGQLVKLKTQSSKLKTIEAEFYDLKTGKEIKKRIITVDLKPETAEKGTFVYFMLKEIMEQKDTIRRAVNQDDKEILRIARMIGKAYGTFAVACGTAGYASMIGEYLFAQIARKHINFVVASEFFGYEPFLTSKTLMLVTSQSGETADVLEAMEAASRKGVKIVSLVNALGSSIAKKSDYTFYINAGPEKAVASTKAATSQIALHTLLAYAVAGRLKEGKQLLINTAAQVNDMLNPRYERHIRQLAERLKTREDMYVIGRGCMYPVALEIALKIKEISYIHADAFPGGELKHGTLALIEKGTPCIVAVSEDAHKEAILSNAREVQARGGYIIGIAGENSEVFDYYIRVPSVGNAQPIVSIIAGQILAYHLAVLRGHNPDKPRNLAKSVTVK